MQEVSVRVFGVNGSVYELGPAEPDASVVEVLVDGTDVCCCVAVGWGIESAPIIYRNISLSVMIPASVPFRPSSPSMTTSRWTRLNLMSFMREYRVSFPVQVITPGKSCGRCLRASSMVRSRFW